MYGSKGFFIGDPQPMHLFREVFLLFSLNLLDAILTIIWVRTGVAPEGNQLMASVMEHSDFAFVGVKILMGTLVAVVILRWGNRKLARYGVAVALAVYISVMGIHLLTFLTAVTSTASLVAPQQVPELIQYARAAL
jgi:hypothetical protein